jgi:hypothetical protein
MDNESIVDQITDLIAGIEAHRQQIEKQTGFEPSRNYALRRLREALLEAREVIATKALTAEIGRVEALVHNPGNARHPWRDAHRGSGKTQRRRRRNIGRRSGG